MWLYLHSSVSHATISGRVCIQVRSRSYVAPRDKFPHTVSRERDLIGGTRGQTTAREQTDDTAETDRYTTLGLGGVSPGRSRWVIKKLTRFG